MPPLPVDLVADVDEAKSNKVEFRLEGAHWKRYIRPPSGDINWTIVAFEASSAKEVPTAKGIYGFVVHSSVAPEIANFLMYVGKAEKGLRKRFREYLKEAESPTGRPAVVYLLKKWKDHVRFWHAVLPPNEIIATEKALIDALAPPANKQFSAQIRHRNAAF
jgi:hypothetical protein